MADGLALQPENGEINLNLRVVDFRKLQRQTQKDGLLLLQIVILLNKVRKFALHFND